MNESRLEGDLARPGPRHERLTELLEQGAVGPLRDALNELHPAEAADWFESLPARDRDAAWSCIDPTRRHDVLAEIEDAVRAGRLVTMRPEELAALAAHLDEDDVVDILQELPEEVMEDVLEAMAAQDRERLARALAFPEDSAGGLMNRDAISVRADVTVEVVQRYLRRLDEIPPATNRLMVVDRDGRLRGTIRLADLLTRDAEEPVEAFLQGDVAPISADLPANEVSKLFERRDYVSAPVVDGEGRLLGRITVDDVLDVIRDEEERSFMQMAGLDEEDDLFGPVGAAARRRLVWLGTNLATALVAAWVIGRFDETIEQVVALAILMPVVASMGGIAGTQTLTIAIRGIALGQLGFHNARALVGKELMVGGINGLVWAAVVAAIAALWFRDPWLGAVVAAALLLNTLVAALAGASLPLLLRRLSIDPALAGGVVLTTITDVVGFAAILGLGALALA